MTAYCCFARRCPPSVCTAQTLLCLAINACVPDPGVHPCMHTPQNYGMPTHVGRQRPTAQKRSPKANCSKPGSLHKNFTERSHGRRRPMPCTRPMGMRLYKCCAASSWCVRATERPPIPPHADAHVSPCRNGNGAQGRTGRLSKRCTAVFCTAFRCPDPCAPKGMSRRQTFWRQWPPGCPS